MKFLLGVIISAAALALPVCGGTAETLMPLAPEPVCAYAEAESDARLSVDIRAGGRVFTYTDAPVVPSDFTVAEEIELRRINAPAAGKLELVDVRLKKGADYRSALLYCFPTLKSTVDAVAASVYEPPVEPRAVRKGSGFEVLPGRAGKMLDEQKLYAAIYCCLRYAGGKRAVDACTVDLPPEKEKAELEKALVLRGEYTTSFAGSSAARAHNVSLAVKAFDGMCVRAGETLSFNDTVGARTAENGFMPAKIIVDGKYIEGIGGGACQASTAVYNAALVAGLPCAANAHSICPQYCPPGLDAMISSVSDLTVRNATAHDIYIAVTVSGDKATVKIFGEPNEYVIRPESVVKRTVAAQCVEFVDSEHKYFGAAAVRGDRLLVSQGKDGCESETYLNYYKSGELVRRVMIRGNVYSAVPQVTAVAP